MELLCFQFFLTQFTNKGNTGERQMQSLYISSFVSCYLLHYACSVFCSDQPKYSLQSFSLLLVLLGLTAISAYLCLFVVRVLSGLVSVSPSGVSTVSRCSPWVPCWASHTRITYPRIKTQSPQHVQPQRSVWKGIRNHSVDFNKKLKLITDLLAITMIDWQLNSSMFQSDEL